MIQNQDVYYKIIIQFYSIRETNEMASISTTRDNITIPLSNIEKIKDKVAIFAKLTVKVISIAALTIVFPIISGIVAVRVFFNSSIQDRAVLVRFRAAISMAMIPIPLIGPVLYYTISDDTINKKINSSKHTLTFANYLIVSIPFVSALCISISLFYKDEDK